MGTGVKPEMQFDNMPQQREAATLGMWVFLSTEVLFFGGLFMGYLAYRFLFGEAFMEGSKHQHLVLGSVNTLILLTSSLTMALAVHGCQEGNRRRIRLFLLATALLGTAFLGIKGIEYYEHWVEDLIPGANFLWTGPLANEVKMYFYLYYAMTGLHAMHLAVGIAVVIFMALRAVRFSAEYYTPVELTGLYWHFVDIVWVFLFPLLYLIS